MTVKELIELLEQHENQESYVYLRNNDGTFRTLWEANISEDEEGDIIFGVKY